MKSQAMLTYQFKLSEIEYTRLCQVLEAGLAAGFDSMTEEIVQTFAAYHVLMETEHEEEASEEVSEEVSAISDEAQEKIYPSPTGARTFRWLRRAASE